jgi:Cft2 family RNA processing exonuclease
LPAIAGQNASEVDNPEAGVVDGSSAKLAALTSERDQFRSRVTTLEAQLLEARSRIPSTNQRRRQHKQERNLGNAEKELQKLRQELEDLGEERDKLIGIRKELEDELAEGEEARAVAQRKSQQLERTLASDEGRAEYLRRSLDRQTSELSAAVDELPNGSKRTDARHRLASVTELSGVLDKVFPKVVAPEIRTRRVTVGPSLDFAVTPIGGGTEIGGSSILIEAASRRILVDAGTRPKGGGPREIQSIIDGEPIEALVITHAHNDHAGYVPALVSKFPRMRVICSDATQHLLPTMWTDSAKVMDRSFSEAAEGETALPPAYGEAETEAAVEVLEVHPCNRTFTVGDLHLTLFPAGHILGAVGVVIEGGGHKIVVTGDISGVDDHYLSVETARLPEGLVAGADLLVIETTYCGSEHRPRQEQERGLVETVSSVVEHRGRVLIPAFGLGRAQEVVMILTQRLPDVDILVDGLAKDVTRIYEVIAKDAGRSLSILGGHVQPVMIRSRQLRSFTSGVIVASSGMLTGGPSVAWAKEILPDPKAALLLCGYQDEEAPGRRLEHLADGRQEPTLRLPDEGEWVDVPVHARVYKYGLSAHADRAGLIDIIERIRPQNTMLVHGYPEKQEPFRTELHRKQIPTVPTQRWSSCPS